MRLHPLVQTWMDSLRAHDLERLAALYHPEARLDVASESFSGREEILDGMRAYRKFLRLVDIQLVQAEQGEGRVGLITDIRNAFGAARIRHELILDGRGIRSHQVQTAPAS